MGMLANVDIVQFDPTYLPDLYRICLLTGEDGNSAEAMYAQPDLLGHYYAAPYGVLEPESCFMLVDYDGACGYVVGTRDSVEFAKRFNAKWRPVLRDKLTEPRAEDCSLDARMIRRIHAGYAAPALSDDYPAHLHINLLPRAQGQGAGRRLIERFLSHLCAHAVRGVHLGVGAANERAMAFYEHLGFRCIERPPWGRRYGLQLCARQA